MMDRKIADGSWENTVTVRKKPLSNPACLRDDQGRLRSSMERGEVMAKHFAQKQFGKKAGWEYEILQILNNLKYSMT